MKYVSSMRWGLKNKESDGSLIEHDLSDNLDYIFSYTQHPKENEKGLLVSHAGFY